MKCFRRLLMVALVVSIAPLAFAQGEHPAYLHALSDLRTARWLLEHVPGDWVRVNDEINAVKKIDDAINEIKRASIDDGMDLNYHPAVDERADHPGRLHDAAEVLRKARADIDQEEDSGAIRGLRGRAAHHIEEAIRFVENAIRAVGVPAPLPQGMTEHPAYLHALSDLRAARWLLEHVPGDWVRVNDEINAVRKIDDAINEIKRASIDDGKNINDHPAVDEKPDRHGRLHDAADFLRKARADIDQEEDNGVIRGLRGRAAQHIDGAIRFVENAIRM
jgi:ribosomal protein S13